MKLQANHCSSHTKDIGKFIRFFELNFLLPINYFFQVTKPRDCSEAGYLIPMVPFIILLLARALDRRMFWFFCVAVILSPFFFTLRDNHVQPAGMILADHNQRIGIDNYVESFLNRTSEMHTKSLFIVGHYLPWIEASTWETSQDNIRYLYRIDQAQYDQAISEGWSVYYLPGTQQYSLRQFGLNLVEAGAIAFDLWQ